MKSMVILYAIECVLLANDIQDGKKLRDESPH